MYLIFDIGGTKMRFASSFDGKNLQDIVITQTPRQYEQAIKLISDFLDKSSDLSHDGNEIVIGLPGVFNKEKTELVAAPNLPMWVAKPIKKDVEGFTNSKVFLENDAELSGLGEAVHGSGIGFPIVAYITLSTGIGGARIVNGNIDVSKYGFEPGHQIINADVVIGGRMIDFEGLVSGIGIQTRYGKKPEEITDLETWKEIEKFISVGLANTILHWSPDVLVLGGGLLQSEFLSIERIKKTISELISVFPTVPEIRKGTLGDEAGLFGGLKFLVSKSSER
jgi:predicted NBD/HSP70 family sugar kinase